MPLTALIDLIFDFAKARWLKYLPLKGYFLDQLRAWLKAKVVDLALDIQGKQKFQGLPPTDLIVDLKNPR